MAKILMVLIASLFFFACGKPLLEEQPQDIDRELLKSASKAQCPQGRSYQQYTDDFKIGQQMFPNPVVFAIQGGDEACALEAPIDDSGVQSFLQVSYSGNCIKNHTLWTPSLMREDHMQKRFYFELKPLNLNTSGYINVNSASGRSMADLRNKMGLVMYHCVSNGQ